MPISTSVITGTRAHKHTADSSDGSFLDANSVTGFSNLTEGGIIQGDNGNQATNLPLGNPATILQVNAGQTALEYVTPTDLTGSMEFLGSTTLVAAAANLELTGTWTAADYAYFIIVLGASNDNSGGTPSLEMRLNGSAAANYHTNMILNTAGVLSATTSGAATSGLICTTNVIQPSSTETCQTIIQLQLSEQSPANTFRWTWSNSTIWAQFGAVPSNTEQIAGLFGNNFQTQLTTLTFFFSDASNFRIGSNVFLYGVKRSG